jgi:hypothetical protein
MTAPRPDDPGEAVLERLAKLGDAVLANDQEEVSPEQPARQEPQEPPDEA